MLVSMKVVQEVEISELTVEAGKNLEEVVVQHDSLGHYLLKLGYSKTEIMPKNEGDDDVNPENVNEKVLDWLSWVDCWTMVLRLGCPVIIGFAVCIRRVSLPC
ncbi:hypothetical protein GIB67_016591 [Kingdonia uniflora]|uniref:Uncharacterized protein n=1 Tax=Kingdonia uniflora TaxID=39325 RepID=A0A7J7MZ07_9MAGN|nr:hypothetical protein GIB67_016591 [Kingdonia uniflora]